MAVVYHWKHGWIPLDHTAALSKAKGNHDRARQYLEAAHSHDAGIRSRQDLAKATRDLPNVPAGERDHARAQVMNAAVEHNSTDLLPSTMQPSRASDLAAKAAEMHARAQGNADRASTPDRAANRLSGAGLAQAGRNTDAMLAAYVKNHEAAQKLDFKAGLAASREAEAARTKLTSADIQGARFIRDKYGWHEVVRVNGKTVTVKTPNSWTDSIPHAKVLEVRH